MKHSIISHSFRRKSLQKELVMTAHITYKANSLDDTNKDSVKRSLIKTSTNEVIETLLVVSISRNMSTNSETNMSIGFITVDGIYCSYFVRLKRYKKCTSTFRQTRKGLLFILGLF